MTKKFTDIFTSQNEREAYLKKDQKIVGMLEKIIRENKIGAEGISKDFMPLVRRRHLPKILALYELFKKIIDVPGSIVEVGVFRGSSLFTWHHLMEIFFPADRMRFVYGFDTFEGINNFIDRDQGAKSWCEENVPDFMISSKKFIEDLIEYHNADSFFPGTDRIKLFVGDVSTTIPQFKKTVGGARISLLNIDVNSYIPVKVTLENFYDLVLPGGIISFSGYTTIPWEGEAAAIEEFFKDKPFAPQKIHWSSYPRAYMIKSK